MSPYDPELTTVTSVTGEPSLSLHTRRIALRTRHEDRPSSIATRTRPHTVTAETSRSYTTHLLEAGYDPLFVQQQLGHSYASTTSLYTSVSSDFKQRVIQQMITRRLRMEDSGG